MDRFGGVNAVFILIVESVVDILQFAAIAS
ncbi:MAG: hypothetical protein ACI81O_001928 [Cyclobacteriaceae bacterium]|jgi:hypothetical protein